MLALGDQGLDDGTAQLASASSDSNYGHFGGVDCEKILCGTELGIFLSFDMVAFDYEILSRVFAWPASYKSSLLQSGSKLPPQPLTNARLHNAYTTEPAELRQA